MCKMSIGNYYVSGYFNEYFVTNLFNGLSMSKGLITDVVVLESFREVPYTNYIVVSSRQLILAVVPVLAPIPSYITQRRINLSYASFWLDQR